LLVQQWLRTTSQGQSAGNHPHLTVPSLASTAFNQSMVLEEERFAANEDSMLVNSQAALSI